MVDKNDSGDEASPVTDLESALAGLKPSRSQIDRDRFLFLAGKVAAEAERRPSRLRWVWPASTLLSASVALVLLALLLARPTVVSFRTDLDVPPTVTDSNDAPHATSVVASRSDNSASAAPVAGELETESTEPSLAEVADLASGTPLNSLRLRYDRVGSREQVASKGSAVAEPAPVSRGPLVPSPIEAPRTQRELLREFLGSDRLAEASQENHAG
jgi:hypothetical protein